METWMHAGANLSAARTPVHATGGCGGRQRKSPSGGVAKGMPLYTVAPSSAMPWTRPDCVRTGLGVCACNPDTEQSAAVMNARVVRGFIAIQFNAFRAR